MTSKIDWRWLTICDSLPLIKDLAIIIADYAQHTEIEKVMLVFNDQESLGRASISIPVDSSYYIEPLVISWVNDQWRSTIKTDGRLYTYSISSAYWLRRRSDGVDRLLPSDLFRIDDYFGDKYKKIRYAYQTFMADAMARY